MRAVHTAPRGQGAPRLPGRKGQRRQRPKWTGPCVTCTLQSAMGACYSFGMTGARHRACAIAYRAQGLVGGADTVYGAARGPFGGPYPHRRGTLALAFRRQEAGEGGPGLHCTTPHAGRTQRGRSKDQAHFTLGLPSGRNARAATPSPLPAPPPPSPPPALCVHALPAGTLPAPCCPRSSTAAAYTTRRGLPARAPSCARTMTAA